MAWTVSALKSKMPHMIALSAPTGTRALVLVAECCSALFPMPAEVRQTQTPKPYFWLVELVTVTLSEPDPDATAVAVKASQVLFVTFWARFVNVRPEAVGVPSRAEPFAPSAPATTTIMSPSFQLMAETVAFVVAAEVKFVGSL